MGGIQEEKAGQPKEVETRLSPRFILLVVFAIVLLLSGLFVSSPIIVIAVAIITMLGFTILSFRRPDLARIQIARTLERVQVGEGDTCRVRLAIKNEGNSAIPLVRIADLLPEELIGPGTRSNFAISLRAGELRNLIYEVNGTAFGHYKIGPVLVSSQDSAGMIEANSKLDLFSTIVVFPTAAGKLSGFTIGPRTTRPRPGEIQARQVGAGLNYFGTRQLLLGENSKRINWKATARSADEDKLQSNEFASQQVAETLIIGDCRSNIGTKDDGGSIVSYSVGAAMSVAERLLRDKNRVGLLAMGATIERVPPAYGRRQFDRITLTLSKIRSGRAFAEENLPYLVRYFFPRISQIVLVSPLIDDEGNRTALELARASATFDLMVVSPNPLDFPLDRNSKSRLAKSTEGRLAWKLAIMERDSNINRLQSAKAIVLDWHVKEPLEQIVFANRYAVARRIAQLARR